MPITKVIPILRPINSLTSNIGESHASACTALRSPGWFDRPQEPPYVNSLTADPPYYRVRYEASVKPGELAFPASYTLWVRLGLKESISAALAGVLERPFTVSDNHWVLELKEVEALLAATGS